MHTDKIILNREKQTFTASFCIIQETLTSLTKLSILHRDEKAYYDTLKFDKRKHSYLLGRLAAKKAIAELTGEKNISSIAINYGVFHFPIVKNAIHQNIQVSITHCDDIGIALAFPEAHPLGVDIERMDENRMEAMKSQMNATEFELITNGNIPLSLGCTAFWTIKEALSKIFRTGLTMDFKILEINAFEQVDLAYISTYKYHAQYKAISYAVGEYICSIVLPKNTTPVLQPFWNSLTDIANGD